MRLTLSTAAAVICAIAATSQAQSDPNSAMNSPDQLAWTLFLQVNADAKTAASNNALFETWASDGDTFQTTPRWPATPSPLNLKPRALGLAALRAKAHGNFTPFVVPGGNNTEETRRNKPDFDFIVANSLYKVSGLKAAFNANKVISFPADSLEVKANWVELGALKDFNGFTGTPAEAAKLYHVNSASGKQYALVSMHVISKLVPNWTWATFEHKDNPGRCDVIGCRDSFGAQQTVVPPQSPTESNTKYPDCAKSAALTALFAQAKIDPAFSNYCLKGSQADLSDPTGLSIRLGNSVTENGFVNQASCMTCHGRAAFDSTGGMIAFAGFDPVTPNLPPSPQNMGQAPVGPIDAGWYWAAATPPYLPMLAGDGSLTRIALPADFVWSVPFCAIDDTAKPPQTKSKYCGGK